jgi:surfactin synthase thioesterase subunit
MSATSQSHQPSGGNRWISGRRSVGDPAVRLICLPQAGAGAGAFSGWRPHVPDGFELAPVELPARGSRAQEPMPRDFDELLDGLFDALLPELTMPYVLFGHSFGGSLAYEITCRVEREGLPAPLATLVSGSRPPQVPARRKMSERDDSELIGWLVDNDGLPPVVLKYTDFVRQIVGVIRDDLRMAENYLVPRPVPLNGPLHVFGGVDDQVVPADGLHHWKQCAAGEFSLTVLPGRHTFPHTGPAAMVAALLDVLPDLPGSG